MRSDDFGEGRPSRSGGFNDERRNDRFNNDRRDNNFRPRQNSNFYEEQQLNRIDWSQVDLPPLTKNFFKPSETALSRSKAEIQAFLQQHDIKVRGRDANQMIFDFEEAGFPNYITDQLTQRDFKKPSVIQSMAWPLALAGRDLVGIAQTGSGNYL